MANLSPIEEQELRIRERIAAGVSEDEELRLREALDRITSQPVQRKFSPETERRFREQQRNVLLGLGRGFKDIYEGVQQPFRDEEFRKKAQAEREFFAQTPAGQAFETKAGEIGGQMAPLLPVGGLLGQGLAAGATRFIGSQGVPGVLANLLAAGGTGTALSQTQFRPEETPEERSQARIKQALLGAGLGAGIAAAPGVLTAVSQPVKTATALLSRGKIISQQFKDTSELLKRVQVPGTIGQKGASRFLVRLETALRSGSSDMVKKAINDTNQAIVNSFKRVVGPVSREGVTPAHVGARVMASARGHVKALNETRQAAFKNELDKLGESTIPVKNLQDYLSGKDVTIGGRSFREAVRNELDDLVELSGGTGELPARQFQDLLSQVSKATVGKGKLWANMEQSQKREIAIGAVKSLMNDLDDAIAQGGKGAEILKKARDAYRQNSIPIDQIEGSVLGKILNEPGVTQKGIGQVDFEAIGKTLNKMGPNQIARTMRLMEKWDLKTADKIRQLKVDNAISKATQRTPGADVKDIIELDARKLINELGGDDAARALFGKNYKQFKDAVEAAQTAYGLSGQGAQAIGQAAQVGGSIASRDPTFAVINTARILGPVGLRRALLDPKGQAAIIRIANNLGKRQANKVLITAAETLRQFGE